MIMEPNRPKESATAEHAFVSTVSGKKMDAYPESSQRTRQRSNAIMEGRGRTDQNSGFQINQKRKRIRARISVFISETVLL